MVQQALKSYHELFDKKLENSTYTVILITLMIVLVGIVIPGNSSVSAYGQADIMGLYKDTIIESVVVIDGVSYKISLEKIK